MCEVKEYGLYEIDSKYLKFLYEVDSEVYYNVEYEKNLKPFIGIIIINENYNYFIPLTSSKSKHVKWKLQSKEHFLIYEKIQKEKINENTICKISNKNEIIHIISVLDIKKNDTC